MTAGGSWFDDGWAETDEPIGLRLLVVDAEIDVHGILSRGAIRYSLEAEHLVVCRDNEKVPEVTDDRAALTLVVPISAHFRLLAACSPAAPTATRQPLGDTRGGLVLCADRRFKRLGAAG